MKKEYVKPAIEMAVLSNGQALLTGTNDSNWAEAKEQSEIEQDDALECFKEVKFPDLWGDEDE